MIVYLDLAKERIRVDGPEDCHSLSAVVVGTSTSGLLPDGWGHLGDGGAHAWLSVSRLRTQAGAGQAPEWSQQFEAMIGYALRKGWLDESAEHVRAHIA